MSCEEMKWEQEKEHEPRRLAEVKKEQERAMSASVLMMGSWAPHVGGLFPNNQAATEAGRTRTSESKMAFWASRHCQCKFPHLN